MDELSKGFIIELLVATLVFMAALTLFGCQSECTTGNYECSNNAVMVCAGNGEWQLENDCSNAWPAPMVCVDGDTDADCEVPE